MLTVVLALAAGLSYAVSDFLAQRVTRRGATVVSTLTWVLATGTVITVPVALLVDGVPRGRAELVDVAFAACAGGAYLAAYAALVRGLRVGNISLVTPLASLQGAVAAVLAIVLFAERVTGLTAVGLALAVAGSVLAALTPGVRSGQGADPAVDVPRSAAAAAEPVGGDVGHAHVEASAGAGWGILAALAFGVVVILFGVLSSISSLTAVAVSRTVSLALVLPLALRFGLRMPRSARGIAVVSGVLEASGFLLLALAIAIGPVAVASVLVAQFATFAVILGLVVGRERPRPAQLVGVGCTILAVTVLALA